MTLQGSFRGLLKLYFWFPKFWRCWRQGSAEQVLKIWRHYFWRPSAEDFEEKVLLNKFWRLKKLRLKRFQFWSIYNMLHQHTSEAYEEIEDKDQVWFAWDGEYKSTKYIVTTTLLGWCKDNPFVLCCLPFPPWPLGIKQWVLCFLFYPPTNLFFIYKRRTWKNWN